MSEIRIVDYRSEHQQYFEAFNRAWIERYFEMEPRDTLVLTQPEETIVRKGGAILIAIYDGIVAGTVALRKVDADTFEFTKMAVDEKFRRKGIAEELCYASFRKARELGAKSIILYSNSQLRPAITLYEKLGFRHVMVGNSGYKRSDVKMVIAVEEANKMADEFYSSLKSEL